MLSPLTGLFSAEGHPDLLVGMGQPDDAAVYRINATTAVVASVDFFAPVVDDAATYGAIAAANAMSDVYAMGGEVVLALNIAAFPEDLPAGTVSEILRGAATKMAEGGGIIAGGHTVWDKEPKFGLSVLGLVHPRRILSKAGLRPGDILYLTKPLGTGTVLSAARDGRAGDAWVEAATASMLRLNRHASHIARHHRLRAATDITGFGLLGHLWEMVFHSGVAAEVEADALPLLPGAHECSGMGVHTGGEERNRTWLEPHVTVEAGVDSTVADLAFDPQTSGGLLLACPVRRARVLEAHFARDNEAIWRIGRVVEASTPHLRMR